jgi:Mn2+/Fe2+ NRAMP family transporter
LFAASILPLSTAYTVCEGLGFESGVGMKFGEAPVFYWLYTLLVVAGGALVLVIPGERLVRIVLWSQVLNGVVLPFVLIFMLMLINKKELMGEYVNTRLFNVVALTTTVLIVALSVAWALSSMKG